MFFSSEIWNKPCHPIQKRNLEKLIINASELLELRSKMIPAITHNLPDSINKDSDKITSQHYGKLFSNFDHFKYYDETSKITKTEIRKK